jgi:hypothetical protein
MAARAAQNRWHLEFRARPYRRNVISQFSVTLMTGKPFVAAGELDRDDVVRPVIMRTSRFRIDIDADNFDAVNFHALRSRGQTNTRIDPMIQHTIIITNPLPNDPLC